MILRILITGYSILFIAILANLLADYLNLSTWYKFSQQIIKTNLKHTISIQGAWSILWLFILYPAILSLGYLLGDKIYNLLTP